MRDPFFDHFTRALAGDPRGLRPWANGVAAETGLTVYRNTGIKGCVDALAAQFPTVERVVGPAWLAAAAAVHAEAHPPRTASLLAYGSAFPDWLDGFGPAADMPFLAGLARLDYLWTEASLAEDAPALDAAAVSRLSPESFVHRALVVHPAARFAAFESGIPDLRLALQPPAAPPEALDLEAEPQALLLTRPALDVTAHRIGAGAQALLAACASGMSVQDAALAALVAEPSVPLAAVFADLLSAGAFTSLRTLP